MRSSSAARTFSSATALVRATAYHAPRQWPRRGMATHANHGGIQQGDPFRSMQLRQQVAMPPRYVCAQTHPIHLKLASLIDDPGSRAWVFLTVPRHNRTMFQSQQLERLCGGHPVAFPMTMKGVNLAVGETASTSTRGVRCERPFGPPTASRLVLQRLGVGSVPFLDSVLRCVRWDPGSSRTVVAAGSIACACIDRRCATSAIHTVWCR